MPQAPQGAANGAAQGGGAAQPQPNAPAK
jgi:hypothetical protein